MNKSARTEGPRPCGTLAASDTNGPGTNMFDPAGCQKVRRTVVICICCISAPHRPNAPFRSDMAATSAPLEVNFGQQAPTWTHLGATSAPYGFKMPNPKSSKRPFSLVLSTFFLLSMMLRLKCCVSVGPVELSPKGPKLRHFGHDLDFHVHHVASLGPNFSPTSSWVQDSAIWAWAKLGPFRGSPGPSGPNLFCGLNATRWRLACLPLLPTFFGCNVRARPCCPHWTCIAPVGWQGGSNPWNSRPTGCFTGGPDPSRPLLSPSGWINLRGPSLACLNRRFLPGACCTF